MAEPRVAMILAGGLGPRARPLTETLPAPLLTFGGRALIEHALDRFAAAGVERVLINIHHHRTTFEQHFRARRTPPAVELLHEPELLGSGGAIGAALGRLGEAPFFVANADTLWFDGFVPALERLDRAWDDARMDALLLLPPVVQAHGYDGPGDFKLEPSGRAHRRVRGEMATHAYGGVALLSARAFEDAPPTPYSLAAIFEHVEIAARLGGIAHDGLWFHVDAPASLVAAEIALGYRATEAPVAERLG
jgi:MurNAc alpha-1-phosphate uridylyltransferase